MKKTVELIKNISAGKFVPDSKKIYDEAEVYELARLLRRIRYAPSQIRKRLQQLGVTVVPASFYSEIPTVEEIEESVSRPNPLILDELFDVEKMAYELEQLSVYAKEFSPPVENIDPQKFSWKGGPFSQCDAMAYYCYIRRVKPATIIEIGSGWSTLVAKAALEANQSGRIISIEPYPTELLKNLDGVQLIEQKVQELDAGFLDRHLSDNDILFIDSTHTVKHDSDCLHIYLRMLPQVSSNIYVHAHDIYLPQGLPLNYLRDKQVFWTEQYLLYAYMMDNPRTEILYATQFHMLRNRESMRSFMMGRYPEGGASIWISHSKRSI